MEFKISVVVVTYNSSDLVEPLIHSISQTLNHADYELIIVDNNSTDNTVSRIRSLSDQIKIVSNSTNVGFASANNQGFKIARGDLILILNPDVFLNEGTKMQEMCEFLVNQPDIGIIAPRLNYPDGSIQESVRGFPNLNVQLIRLLKLDQFFLKHSSYKRYMSVGLDLDTESFVDWVIGAFMLIRKDVLFEVGLFDAGYFMYMEDADLCMNVHKKGYKICYAPRFSAIHSYKRESAQFFFSRLKLAHIKSAIRFYIKHGITGR